VRLPWVVQVGPEQHDANWNGVIDERSDHEGGSVQARPQSINSLPMAEAVSPITAVNGRLGALICLVPPALFPAEARRADRLRRRFQQLDIWPWPQKRVAENPAAASTCCRCASPHVIDATRISAGSSRDPPPGSGHRKGIKYRDCPDQLRLPWARCLGLIGPVHRPPSLPVHGPVIFR